MMASFSSSLYFFNPNLLSMRSVVIDPSMCAATPIASGITTEVKVIPELVSTVTLPRPLRCPEVFDALLRMVSIHAEEGAEARVDAEV